MNKDSLSSILFVAVFGFSFGISSVLIMIDLEPKIYLWHQPFTKGFDFALSLLIIIPIMEELIKYVIAQFRISFDEKSRLIQALSVGYGFQVGEALFYYSNGIEPDWYIRLVLPLHIFFTFVAIRYSLTLGILFHSVWNSQTFLSNNSQLLHSSFAAIYFILFFVLLYIDRINNVNDKLDKMLSINKTPSIHKVNKL